MNATDKVNYLNVGLLALSLFLAWWIPFELFVIVYMVLGPLHYLSEISWLHDRKYFVREQSVPAVLCILAAAVCACPLIVPLFAKVSTTNVVYMLPGEIIFVALAISVLANLNRQGLINTNNVAIIMAVSMFVMFLPACAVFFATYLTTLVHVFVFTWIFMLAGALKSGRASGFIALIFFSVCAVLCFVPSDVTSYSVPVLFRHDFASFLRLDLGSADLLGWKRPDQALSLMRFIAFAYTYHYLNWFSKTHVIKWHHIPRARLIALTAIYSGSLCIYLVDKTVGRNILLLMSIAHVFLEFPLNIKTIEGLGKQVMALPTNLFASAKSLEAQQS